MEMNERNPRFGFFRRIGSFREILRSFQFGHTV